VVRSGASTNQLSDFTAEELAQYQAQAGLFEVGDILRLIKIGADASGDLKSGLHERLVIEVAALKMAELENTVRLQEVLSYLKNRPQAERQTASPLPKKKSAPRPLGQGTTRIDRGPEPTKANTSTPGKMLTADQVRSGWEGSGRPNFGCFRRI